MKKVIQKITNLFHVNFKIAALDVELNGWVGSRDLSEYILEGARDESFSIRVIHTSAFHGKRLSRACLTIAENGSIIAIKNTIERRHSHFLKNIGLRGLRSKHSIESELVGTLHITNLRSRLTLFKGKEGLDRALDNLQ